MSEEKGTLAEKEAHPAAFSAIHWIRNMPMFELLKWQQSFASCALSGNRLAEVCSETLRRLMDNEPVSDRYVLGLAWSMRDGERLIKSAEKASRKGGKGPSPEKVKRVASTRKVLDGKENR